MGELEGVGLTRETETERHHPFVHVFYRAKRDLGSYVPLVFAYVIMIGYFHFNISQIDMVKSKWGLALAEVPSLLSLFTL